MVSKGTPTHNPLKCSGEGTTEGTGTDLSVLGHRKKGHSLKEQLVYKICRLRTPANRGGAAGTLWLTFLLCLDSADRSRVQAPYSAAT